MFRFANPTLLYLLVLIPVFVLAYILLRRNRIKNIRKFGDPALLKALMPDVSFTRPHVKFSLLMLALALIIFMLARPQFGTRNEEYKRSGIEAIIAVDVSNSMLCEDVTPSRLQKAKMIVSKLIDQLDEDRVGLIAFAGNAITLLPLTQDGVSAKMFLEQLNTQTVSLQGTDMSQAIQRAIAGFSSSESKNVGRALIFITDAEDNEPGAEEMARQARDMGIRIFVLSVGTAAGGPMPLGNGHFKTDKSGNTVMTHLNEEAGKSLAQAGNGIYLHVDQTDRAQAMLESEIGKMQKEDFVSSQYSEYDEQFIAVAILLLFVLIFEICVMEKQNRLFRKFSSFGRKISVENIEKTAMILFAVLCTLPVSAQNAKENIRLGNYFFRDGQFDKAETFYTKSLDKNKSLEALYNLGNAQLMQGRDSDAYVTFQKAVEIPSNNNLKRSQLFHNMGCITYAGGLAHYKMQDGHANQLFGTAVEEFKSALRLNPNDHETRYNLAMAQYMFKKTKNDDKQNNQDQNKDNKDDQNKDQNKDNKDDQNKDNKDQDKDQNKDKQDQDKDQNKDNKDQNKDKQDQNKDNNDKQNQPQQPQQKKGQMDEKTAEQLLNSAQQDEKNVQKKLIRQPQQRRSLDKDW